MAEVYPIYKMQRDRQTGKMVKATDPRTGEPIKTNRWGTRYLDRYERRKRKRLPYRGKSKKEAQKQADLLEAKEREIALGLRAAPAPKNTGARKSVKVALEEHMKWGRFEGGRGGYPWSIVHARDRESYVSWCINELGWEKVGDLDASLPEVEKAMQKLASEGRPHRNAPDKRRRKPLSRKTIKEVRAHLSGFCNWCIDEGYLTKNPLEAKKSRWGKKIQPEVLRRESTVEELKALLDAAPLYHRMLIIVAICSGLRRGELRSLTLGHLDRTTATLRIDADRDKARELRYQPLPVNLFEPLYQFAKSGKPKELYVRHNKRGKAPILDIPDEPLLFVPTHTARTLAGIAEKAGIPKLNGKGKLDFHSLRTSYVNLLLAMGVDPKTVQGLARHESSAMTMETYGRFQNGSARQATEKLGELFNDVSFQYTPYLPHRDVGAS